MVWLGLCWVGSDWGFAERGFFLIDGFGALAGELAGVFVAVDDSKEDAFVQGELVDRLDGSLELSGQVNLRV